jgi:hypothetical protein
LLPLDPDGRPALARILVSVLRRPSQVWALGALGGEVRQALAALGRAAPELHSLLAG